MQPQPQGASALSCRTEEVGESVCTREDYLGGVEPKALPTAPPRTNETPEQEDIEVHCAEEKEGPETVEGPRVATDQDNGDSKPELHDVDDSMTHDDPMPSTTNMPSWIMEMFELVDYIQETVNERMSTTVGRGGNHDASQA